MTLRKIAVVLGAAACLALPCASAAHADTSSGTGTGTGAACATKDGDATAAGAAFGSPGVASGNLVQVPVHVPVNVCGNTVNVIGIANPA